MSSTARNTPVAVKLAGSCTDGTIGVSSDNHTLELLRPRSNIKKECKCDIILPDGSFSSDAHAAFMQKPLEDAIADGRSAYVLSLGSEHSGKSTSVRGSADDPGLALETVGHLFEVLGEAEAQGIESLVTVSGTLCAIMSGAKIGERLLDALAPPDEPQPASGYNVRERADGLPTHAAFFAEGVREVEAPNAEAAELLVRRAMARAQEEEGGAALRIHLLLSFTVRQRRTSDDVERSFSVNLVDVAGVPRPRTAEAGGGKGGVAAGGRGGALAVRARGRGGGGVEKGEDPFVKALLRIVDTLQDHRPGGHVPYRDSKLTRLIAPCLCGGALCLPLVHVRVDRYEEAEAALSLVPKLRILSTLVQAGGVVRPTAASGARTSRAKGGWWSPSEELQATEETVEGLAASLGMSRSNLISSAIELDHTSSDELLALQEALLRSERLTQRLRSWDSLRPSRGLPSTASGGDAKHEPRAQRQPPMAPPPPTAPPVPVPMAPRPLATQPVASANVVAQPAVGNEAIDAYKLKLLHQKAAAVSSGGWSNRSGVSGSASSRPFVPAPGVAVLAELGKGGEYARGKITATSRADDGSTQFVVKFERSGQVLHLPADKIRRANSAAPPVAAS